MEEYQVCKDSEDPQLLANPFYCEILFWELGVKSECGAHS